MILAGGFGTRLKGIFPDVPKPMVPIFNMPLLEHQIIQCRNSGFKTILLLLHHQHHVITEYFGDGSKWDVNLQYQVEQIPRGTAGALFDSLGLLGHVFLVLYGDTFFDVDLKSIWNFHKLNDADVTLFLHPNNHPADSDLVEIDDHLNVCSIHPYATRGHELQYRNLVNAALYVVKKSALSDAIPLTGVSDLARDTFPLLLKKGDVSLKAYLSPEYIKDMGTPDRLIKVERDLNSGMVDNLSSRKLRSAVFLDRDGTINKEVNHLCSVADLELIPGADEAIKSLNDAGTLAICVTNQPVIARGDLTLEGLNAIHAKLDFMLGHSGAYLDRTYICPHHPDGGFKGEVSNLKFDCECRKPKTGLIDLAVRELEIDRQKSWIVGDSSADISAGAQSGLKTILVRTGHGVSPKGASAISPDYIVPNIKDAVSWILGGHARVLTQLWPILANVQNERVILVGGLARSGKSFASQVIREQMTAAGRRVHILCLDGWLHSTANRIEGSGVEHRYDRKGFLDFFLLVMDAGVGHYAQIPIYDRNSKQSRMNSVFIAPEDLLIVEGVPVLMEELLIKIANIRIFVEIDEDERLKRFLQDYEWRGISEEEARKLFRSRLSDEIPQIMASSKAATHYLKGI